jgi:transcriptional regulator with XRE-family HTH domain
MKLTVRAELRRRAGLTQHGLRRLTGITDTRISLWETGQIALPEEDLEKIAQTIQRELERVPGRLTVPEIFRVLSVEPQVSRAASGG